MNILLQDNGLHLRFAPLTLTRPVGNLRMGIFTNDERWKQLLPEVSVYFGTEKYLQPKFPATDHADLLVNAAVIANRELADAAVALKEGDQLIQGDTWILQKGDTVLNKITYTGKLVILTERWDLYQQNGEVLKADFALLTADRKSQPLSASNTVIGDPLLVFLEAGASVEASILNTKEGPVYIGSNAEIMEGCIVRGPLALCESAGLKLGTKVYGPTTLGPHVKVGGEVNNVIFQAYSNKGHDGFLGNSVIGEWCNLGADTNASNLKNDYGLVSAYSYETREIEKTSVTFMGLIMGDHSKCGINTMFNTATVVGVSANIYGAGFPEKQIPSFSWGGPEGMVPFRLDKAIKVAEAMMSRRNVTFTEADQAIFEHLVGSETV